jgi:hypothetical protein
MVIAVEIVDYILTKDHSVVVGVLKVLKILMFAMNGEKGILRDNAIIQ